MVVTTLTRLKSEVRWPYQRLCGSLGLPYANFRRWKHRLSCGQPAFSKPGPKKVAPLDLDELRGDVSAGFFDKIFNREVAGAVLLRRKDVPQFRVGFFGSNAQQDDIGGIRG